MFVVSFSQLTVTLNPVAGVVLSVLPEKKPIPRQEQNRHRGGSQLARCYRQFLQ